MTGVRSLLSRPLLLACLVAACGGDDLVLPNGGPVGIRVVDGDGQQGSVGELLGSPVVVEVTDGHGDPMAGVPVAFALRSAGQGAEISPSTATTGADGRTEAHFLLGDKVGLQTGEATVTGNGAPLPSTTFSALAVEDSPPPSSPDPPEPPASPPPSDNKEPQADFEVHCHDLRCTFEDKSTDDDGNITTRQWEFGDGATSSDRNPEHVYGGAGTFQVTLTATDNDGASDTRTRNADPESPDSPPSPPSPPNPPSPPPDPPSPPPAQNKAPRAEFDVVCQDLRCTFVDRSSDEDGRVVGWQWDFGDGSTSTDRNPSHAYGTAGKFNVLLVVTDDDGAADTRSHRADPKAPPGDPPPAPPPPGPPPPDPPSPPPPGPPPPPPAQNRPPHADFHDHCEDGAVCDFEDTSKDDDGTVVSWLWTFGDGGTSSERNPSHAFPSDGSFDVSLTVVDDDGASNTKTHKIHVKKP